ncbi:MAG: pyridoxamine 5'-phosphate oxidase family protein [Streptosporangiales bacterium]|nr:pyridoxamine 5'-phosphate oxidase family protein [Streptosporangiales bacterium]MBO0890033.1 pyridoxamine 5'-phosphate oxidase family protein [Acidothermales bacterium]
MRESDADLDRLQSLLDESLARSTEHLRSIVRPGERSLTARQLAHELTGMRLLVVATTTARGEPRTSAADGHFLRGRWVFSTSGTAAKARQLAARPAVSVTHLDGERLGVFTHGSVERLAPGHPDFGWVDEHLTEHYGSSPTTWGPDIPYFRVEPTWTVAYAADASEFPE